jgi:hypothetical protein
MADLQRMSTSDREVIVDQEERAQCQTPMLSPHCVEHERSDPAWDLHDTRYLAYHLLGRLLAQRASSDCGDMPKLQSRGRAKALRSMVAEVDQERRSRLAGDNPHYAGFRRACNPERSAAWLAAGATRKKGDPFR